MNDSCGLRGARALAVVAISLSACGTDNGPAPTAPPSTATTSLPAASSTTEAFPDSWVWGVDLIDLAGGYRIGPCAGDADQLACFTLAGETVGAAERITFPVDSFPVLAGVDDPVESIELLAADFVATFAADRQAACPDLGFEGLDPVRLTVSGHPGLRYGFRQVREGDVVEQVVVYGMRAGAEISLYNVSAIAEGACLSAEGELTDPVALAEIVPALDQVMAVVDSG